MPTQGECIAELGDGRACGRPATILDIQRGGWICLDCLRAEWRRREAELLRRRLAAIVRLAQISGTAATLEPTATLWRKVEQAERFEEESKGRG